MKTPETAWYEDVPKPDDIEDTIVLRARKLRTETGRGVMGLSLEHFARNAGCHQTPSRACLDMSGLTPSWTCRLESRNEQTLRRRQRAVSLRTRPLCDSRAPRVTLAAPS